MDKTISKYIVKIMKQKNAKYFMFREFQVFLFACFNVILASLVSEKTNNLKNLP